MGNELCEQSQVNLIFACNNEMTPTHTPQNHLIFGKLIF